MTLISEPWPSQCACGCGEQILPHHASPDFRYPHCQSLWLVSLDKPDPRAWRKEQRLLTLLFSQHWDWASSVWEFEWIDLHIGRYDPSNEGDVARGLDTLCRMYREQCDIYGVVDSVSALVRH